MIAVRSTRRSAALSKFGSKIDEISCADRAEGASIASATTSNTIDPANLWRHTTSCLNLLVRVLNVFMENVRHQMNR